MTDLKWGEGPGICLFGVADETTGKPAAMCTLPAHHDLVSRTDHILMDVRARIIGTADKDSGVVSTERCRWCGNAKPDPNNCGEEFHDMEIK